MEKDKAKQVRAKLEADGVEVEWTAREVAAYLGCSTASVYLLCRRRKIPHRKFTPDGNERPQLRFRRTDIDEWRAKHSEVVAV